MKTIYYDDELNNEFSEAQITPKKIDGNYKYYYTSIWKKITHIFWYRIIAFPIAKAYLFFKFRHKMIGRKKLKKYKKVGYFIFGNHTHHLCDAVIPSMINGMKDTYVIVHPNNVSMPYLGRVTPSLGAVPLPDDKEATKNFVSCIEYRLKGKKAICIYPEAHIWPFYTKIRPFLDTSFRYPVSYNTPVFCFTNTYQKRKHSKNPKVVTYIDGPFFPEEGLPKKEQRQKLRDEVYNTMVERSKNSNVELIKYVKKEKIND
ncbi:MAG: hypothetical protein MR357_08070 [Anaeroplasma sp.]|nr:hypothetical protein [Anaeroplasma sp.]